jgi:transcriptional regulator of acetoin/glycerol metabolism
VALSDDAELGARYLDPSGQPRFSRDLLRRVVKSPLPTNARGLLYLVLLSIMKSKGDQLDWVEADETTADESDPSSDVHEADRFQQALDDNNGSIEKAWRALGLPNRYALQRRIKQHRLVVRRKAE